MNGLSDLDLVAQAMAPTNSSSTAPKSNGSSFQPANSSAAAPPANGSSTPHTTTTTSPLDDLDLSKLSSEDKALLQPLLDALKLGEADGEEDELRIGEILNQMDVAENVADEIEGKLDRLLESLGKAEEEMKGDVGEGRGKKA